MRIRSYYRQGWAPPGVHPDVLERGSGLLEQWAMQAIDRLVRGPANLVDEDIELIAHYIEWQRIRAPRQADAAKAQMRATVLRLAPSETAAAIRRGHVLLVIKDSARFDYWRMANGKLYPWFCRMEWEIVAAEAGASFVTTDSPVSLYHPQTPPPAEPGLALLGSVVLFPLSSRHALLMRHPEVARGADMSALTVLPDPPPEPARLSITHGAVWSTQKVNNFNWKMVQLADRYVVGGSRDVLEACTSS